LLILIQITRTLKMTLREWVYTQVNNEKIGTVQHRRWGQFRYLAIDLGFWFWQKKLLLPVGRTQIDHEANRVYAIGMTERKQRSYLNRPQNLDDHEEQVRGCIAIRLQLRLLRQALPHLPSTPLTTVIPPTSKMRLCTISMLRIIKPQERLVASASRQGSSSWQARLKLKFQCRWVEQWLSEPAERQLHLVVLTSVKEKWHEETPDIHKEAFVREESKSKLWIRKQLKLKRPCGEKS